MFNALRASAVNSETAVADTTDVRVREAVAGRDNDGGDVERTDAAEAGRADDGRTAAFALMLY